MCNINYTVLQKYTHKKLIFQSIKKKHESKYYCLTLYSINSKNLYLPLGVKTAHKKYLINHEEVSNENIFLTLA
jgi:hypothetical protein